MRTPTANAMSVAIGIPQPAMEPRPRFSAAKMHAGTNMPPTAAASGSAARRSSLSSPAVDLATDLEPDDEEEDRHQPVVDPEVQISLEKEGPER